MTICDDKTEYQIENFAQLLIQMATIINNKKYYYLHAEDLCFYIIISKEDNDSQNQRIQKCLKEMVEKPPNPQ